MKKLFLLLSFIAVAFTGFSQQTDNQLDSLNQAIVRSKNTYSPARAAAYNDSVNVSKLSKFFTPKIISGTTYTVDTTDVGMMLVFTNASGCVVSLSNTIKQNVNFSAYRTSTAGDIEFNATGSATLSFSGSSSDIETAPGVAQWWKRTATEWAGFGQLGTASVGGGIIDQTFTGDAVVQLDGHTLQIYGTDLIGLEINESSPGFSTATLGPLDSGTGGNFFVDVDGAKIKSGAAASVEGSLFVVNSSGYLEEIPIGANNEVLTSDGTTASWEAAAGGISDGDKGDITVTSTGATWTVDNLVVTPAKMSTFNSSDMRGKYTDETGTGLAYFQDGDIGTPSAGVGTNFTGIPISTGISGLGSGVATMLGTFSSANIATAATNETGSGLLVFATSPTLTTPALGTIASGNLAAGTGYIFSNLASTPTTLAGYGITDAATRYPSTQANTSSYVAALTDAGNFIKQNVATSNTVTIPPQSSVTWLSNTTLMVYNYGAGIVSLTTGSGVTFRLMSGGSLDIPQYGLATLKREASDEWLVWNGSSNATVYSGTYTPTLTNVANIGASTAYQLTYMRVGNSVTVSGRVDIDPTTTATATELGITLPVTSAFTTANQCGGSAGATAVKESAGIVSDATNDRAALKMLPTDVTNQPYYFSFTYEVL